MAARWSWLKTKKRKNHSTSLLQVAERVRNICMEEGLILYTGVGASADITARDYLIIAPPFIITREETDTMLHLLANALSKAETVFS